MERGCEPGYRRPGSAPKTLGLAGGARVAERKRRRAIGQSRVPVKSRAETRLALDEIERQVVACNLCPRLRAHCESVAREKRRAFRDQVYWGKPVPAFGDSRARLLVVGLAPAAHGGNRTGRMFTGDSSGDWLYRALHAFGFASQSDSVARDDGLRLRDCFVSAAARCAPPGNRPLPVELDRCRPYLAAETRLLNRVEVVVALGHVAHDAWLRASGWHARLAPSDRPRFAHGAEARMPGGLTLLSSYHPSRQNTNTGRLTKPMWDEVFRRAREILDSAS
jgi:uracil-DNA glycosylase family 4